jgi:hypothetical protein
MGDGYRISGRRCGGGCRSIQLSYERVGEDFTADSVDIICAASSLLRDEIDPNRQRFDS